MNQHQSQQEHRFRMINPFCNGQLSVCIWDGWWVPQPQGEVVGEEGVLDEGEGDQEADQVKVGEEGMGNGDVLHVGNTTFEDWLGIESQEVESTIQNVVGSFHLARRAVVDKTVLSLGLTFKA
jgi:hypothetical protein